MCLLSGPVKALTSCSAIDFADQPKMLLIHGPANPQSLLCSGRKQLADDTSTMIINVAGHMAS